MKILLAALVSVVSACSHVPQKVWNSWEKNFTSAEACREEIQAVWMNYRRTHIALAQDENGLTVLKPSESINKTYMCHGAKLRYSEGPFNVAPVE